MKKYMIAGSLLLILQFIVHIVVAQTTVSGTITDASNKEPLIGVNILVRGTVLGTTTDINGDFNLNVSPAPLITLVITSVGFERQEVEITQSNQQGLNIQLKLPLEVLFSA